MANYIDTYLKPMGLKAADCTAKEIHIDTDVEFGDELDHVPFDVRIVTAKTLDEVKSWIGNPDPDDGSETIDGINQFDANAIDDTDLSTLAEAARHYVYGHSSPVAHLLPAIEGNLGPFDILVASANVIRIGAGKTLTYSGQKPKVVIADKLIFEGAGAKIDSFVHLKMSVSSVEVK